ncbi:MAG: hypothetical protein HY394_05010 [Candidatus Diapherotrites archaeon]|nr:hypothetical protein [Candidatus Diapherotrites archaeon]
MAESKKKAYVVDNLSVKDYGKRLELRLSAKKPGKKKAKEAKVKKARPKKSSSRAAPKHSVETLKRLIAQKASSPKRGAGQEFPRTGEGGTPSAVRLEAFLKKVERRVKAGKAKKPKASAKAVAKKKGKKPRHHKARVIVLIESPPQLKKEKAVIRRTIGEIVDRKEDYLPKGSRLVLANNDIARRWHRFYRASGVPEPFWFLYSVIRSGKVQPSLGLINNYYRIFPFDLESSEFRHEIIAIRGRERIAPSPGVLDRKPESERDLHDLEEGLALREVVRFKEEQQRYPGEDEFDRIADNIVEQLQKSALEPENETEEESKAILDETPKPRRHRHRK